MEVAGVMIILFIAAAIHGTSADTRYYVKIQPDKIKNIHDEFKINDNNKEKPRAIIRLDNDDSIIRDNLKATHDRRNSFIETSTFDPDILNKFLDEYANKIKITTEKSFHPFKTTKLPSITALEIDNVQSTEITSSTEETITDNGFTTSLDNLEGLNDTVKRNKFYTSHSNDDRNGWVTLEAIPWSKSKISKWQANPNSQRPWPEMNKWDKPSLGKPGSSDPNSRPYYENNKPWYDKPKPHLPDHEVSRPKPQSSPLRPSYLNDRYDVSQSQAQKWPPERPASWNDFSSNHRPNIDIITDNRPSNFPINSNWEKYDQISKPVYSSFTDRYQNDPEEAGNDWPNYSRPRPYYSHYDYENRYPPSHPSSGDGEWVLLSTNRGYQKTRQRSLKVESLDDVTIKPNDSNKMEEPDPVIPVMTSKRQVRLTVLPSINGTNTTTSHGGLLEVEKTFKTVDQSQKEYEANRLTQKIIKKRPIKTSIVGGRPSNSAVLAAVSAGMLPATMAMMIPMMLGRKKRSYKLNKIYNRDIANRENNLNFLISS